MVTPAERGGGPPFIKVSKAPFAGTSKKAQEAFDSAPKAARPDINDPPPVNFSAAPQPKGGIISRVMNFILKFFGLKSGAKQAEAPKGETGSPKSVEELPPSPFEKARRGGPATELFELVKRNPEETVSVAKLRYQNLKDLVGRQNHNAIDNFVKKVDVKPDPKAKYSDKLAIAEEALNKEINKVKSTIASLNSAIPVWEERVRSSELGSEDTNKMIQLREQVIKENETKIKQLQEEIKRLTLFNEGVPSNLSGRKEIIAQNKVDIARKSTAMAQFSAQNVENRKENATARDTLKKEQDVCKSELKREQELLEKTQGERAALEKLLSELSSIKQKAKEILPQLLNSYVLMKAVEAYQKDSSSPPREFLEKYKSENKKVLRKEFSSELREIGMTAPDSLWNILSGIEQRSTQAAQESIIHQPSLTPKEEIPSPAHSGSTTIGNQLRDAKEKVSNIFRRSRGGVEEVEIPLTENQKRMVGEEESPLPLLTGMRENPNQRAAFVEEARSYSEEMEKTLQTIAPKNFQQLLAQTKDAAGRALHLGGKDEKANALASGLNEQVKDVKRKAAIANKEILIKSFRALLKKEAAAAYQQKLCQPAPQQFWGEFIISHSQATRERFCAKLENMGIGSGLVEKTLKQITGEK